MSENTFEIKKDKEGTSFKGSGPLVALVLAVMVIVGGALYFGKDVLAMSSEHNQIVESVKELDKSQKQVVKLLQQQTGLFKFLLEMQAKPVEKRKEFLEIFKGSPTWEGKADSG